MKIFLSFIYFLVVFSGKLEKDQKKKQLVKMHKYFRDKIQLILKNAVTRQLLVIFGKNLLKTNFWHDILTLLERQDVFYGERESE